MSIISFTSVLLGPRLVAFCPQKVSASWPMFESRGRFWRSKLISCHDFSSRTSNARTQYPSSRDHGIQETLIATKRAERLQDSYRLGTFLRGHTQSPIAYFQLI